MESHICAQLEGLLVYRQISLAAPAALPLDRLEDGPPQAQAPPWALDLPFPGLKLI